MSKEGYVTITEEEYQELLEDSNFLECLTGCGVDNWEGYEGAQEMYKEYYTGK